MTSREKYAYSHVEKKKKIRCSVHMLVFSLYNMFILVAYVLLLDVFLKATLCSHVACDLPSLLKATCNCCLLQLQLSHAS